MNIPEGLSKHVTEKKVRKFNKVNLLLGILFIVVIVLGIFFYSLYISFKDQTIPVSNSNLFLPEEADTRVWHFAEIIPEETPGLFNLVLKSNIGNVRNYSSIFSFGLSKEGNYLAINSQEGISVIELNSNSRKLAKTPSQRFFGDFGESISWNAEDHFELSVLINDAGDSNIWIFDNQGELKKSIEVTVPNMTYEKPIIEKSVFSQKNGYILVRSYKKEDVEYEKEDGSKYSIYQAPIYLSVFDLDGNKVKDLNISDYSDADKKVHYGWDDENMIEYLIYNFNESPDLNREYLFTKKSLDI